MAWVDVIQEAVSHSYFIGYILEISGTCNPLAKADGSKAAQKKGWGAIPQNPFQALYKKIIQYTV